MKIGVFDSGYGGLTILENIRQRLPQYDYIYLGDNARTPYGTRSFEVIYDYTLQCIKQLFAFNCQLIVVACNTASARALRTIQQQDLPRLAPDRRVLGVIRPTAEQTGKLTVSRVAGLCATDGTVQSGTYPVEIAKLFPDITVVSEACPMWVPLIENNEHIHDGADYFVRRHIHRLFERDPRIDTLILGCTHYPLLLDKIVRYVPENVHIIVQGNLVAESLAEYLVRHPEQEIRCSKGGTVVYYTTESTEKFNASASVFLKQPIVAEHITIN
ncbi:MAG: glutamate racemase [Prevotellaceae bacterium]|jgi:glutamate racemase|nr:glutamate racemase [Prevotellaceae bacterium]